MAEENTLRANERIREERMRRGWSQQKVADQLGIAVVTVNRWERGKQQPTGYYRLRLSALFEKSVEELGLAEEANDSEATIYSEEPQEGIEEPTAGSQEFPKEIVADTLHSDNSTLYTPSQEKKRAHLSLPFAYNWSDRSSSYKRARTLLLLVVMVLLIISASMTFLLLHLSTGQKSAQAKAPSRSIPTPTPTPTFGPLTPTSLKSIESRTPTLYDPLTSANGASDWSYGNNCQLVHNTMQLNSQGANYCLAQARQFDNALFKMDLSIQVGDWAGVIFRADGDSDFYYFVISKSGQYELELLKPHIRHKTFILETSGSSSISAIHTGSGVWNEITVLADQSHLSFWVNGIYVTQISDSTMTSGYIGSDVDSYNDNVDPGMSVLTIATFRNLYVWAI